MYKTITISAPASATTTVGTQSVNFDDVDSMLIVAVLTGVTGGTLDAYLQIAPLDSDTWVDYAHWTQVAAGASAITRAWSVSRHSQVTSIATVAIGNTPALAANTILGGDFGERGRIVLVTGASTSAGADQVFHFIGSKTARRFWNSR